MMFQHPWYLGLLLLVPLGGWRLWTARRDRAVPFSSIAFASSLQPTWRQRLAWLPTALTLSALTIMIIALARPREGREQTIVESEGIAIEMVVDRSGSMQAMDFQIGDQHVYRQRPSRAWQAGSSAAGTKTNRATHCRDG